MAIDPRGNDFSALNKSADEAALQQIAAFMEETTKTLAEVKDAFKDFRRDHRDDIESRTEGFSTSSGKRRTNQRLTGNALLDELVNISTPSSDYAQSLLQFKTYKPGTLMGYSYIASGAVQRAMQNRRPGEDISQFRVNESYAEKYNPATGRYPQNRTPAGPGHPGVIAPGRMEPKNFQKLKDFALSDAGGMNEASFNDMMDPKGKTTLTDLATRVRAMGDKDLNDAMDRMEAGEGKGGLYAYKGARLAEKYLPYAQAAVSAARTAVGTIDKMYSRGRVSAGLGYGFDYNNPLIFGGGQFQMLQRDLKSKFTAFRPGLNTEDVNAIRTTIEGSGFGQSGQEGAYSDIFNMMGDVTQKTGGALAPGQIMQIAELSMRSGRSSNSMKELTKLLGDELPRAANASRLSIGKMHEQLMSTVQQISQNPFNTSSGADIYRRSVSALNTGAQPAIGGLLAGNNQMLDYLTASRTGESMARSLVNPFGAYNREQTIKQMIQQQLPGVNTLEDFNRLSVNNPDKIFAVQAYLRNFGIDENALPAFFSQNNNAVSAAALLGGLADTKSFRDSTGTALQVSGKNLDPNSREAQIAARAKATNPGDRAKTVDTGGLVSIAGNTEVDPNVPGSASKVLANNREKIEQLRQLLTDEQRKDFDAKLKDLGSTGTATDLTKMFKETQANISQKNAEDQSNGVTISLDPNAAALFSLNNNGLLGKSTTIGGGATPTGFGSIQAGLSDIFHNGFV